MDMNRVSSSFVIENTELEKYSFNLDSLFFRKTRLFYF